MGLRFLLLFFCLAGLATRIGFFLVSVKYLPATTDEALALLIARGIHNGARPLLFWGAPYQFPLESYLMAFFTDILPLSALAVRIIPFLLCLLALVIFTALVRNFFKKEYQFPALALIFIPSAYLFTLQSAYFIPEYSASFVFAALLPLIAAPLFKQYSLSRHFILGIFSGLALSTHLLSLPLVISLTLIICLNGKGFDLLKRCIVNSCSLAIGLSPYLYTYSMTQTVSNGVTGTVTISEFIARFFSNLLPACLSTVLGFSITILPDIDKHSGIAPFLESPGLIFIFLVVVILGLVRTSKHFLSLINGKWINFDLYDVWTSTALLSIASFLFSNRSSADEFRYLLPFAWSLPFLVAGFSKLLPSGYRFILNTVVCSYICLNLAQTFFLQQQWTNSDFRNGQRDLPELEPVITFLNKRNIKHCYASFWHVNRITFESNGSLVCSPPYNERFTDWPLPFKEDVDQSKRAAYVLNDSIHSRLKATHFEKMLKYHELTAKVKIVGDFKIYFNFKPSLDPNLKLLENLDFKIDKNESKGFVKIELAEATSLNRVRLYFLDLNQNQVDFNLKLSKNGYDFKKFKDAFSLEPDRILVRRDHPIFKTENRKDIPLGDRKIKSIQLKLTGSTDDWPLKSIEIFKSAIDEESKGQTFL